MPPDFEYDSDDEFAEREAECKCLAPVVVVMSATMVMMLILATLISTSIGAIVKFAALFVMTTVVASVMTIIASNNDE